MNEKLKSDILKNEADEFWANCEPKDSRTWSDCWLLSGGVLYI